MRKSFTLLSILLLLASPSLHAGMSLSKAILHFTQDSQRSQDVEVFNQGEETLYIVIEPSVILKPGSEQQMRERYRDPRKTGLLVSPQRMVIAPGGKKKIRFVRLDDPKKATTDKVFRVLVKPEVGEVKAEQTAVKVVVAYEVLVLMQPANDTYKLESSWDRSSLRLKNKGNSNVLLMRGVQCPQGKTESDPDNGCVEIPGKRLYAGNQAEFKLPYETEVTLELSHGLDNFTQVIEFNKAR